MKRISSPRGGEDKGEGEDLYYIHPNSIKGKMDEEEEIRKEFLIVSHF